MKGKVFIDTTVYCGSEKHNEQCCNFVQLSGIRYAKEIRRNGWRHTKTHGWICPECIKGNKK